MNTMQIESTTQDEILAEIDKRLDAKLDQVANKILKIIGGDLLTINQLCEQEQISRTSIKNKHQKKKCQEQI